MKKVITYGVFDVFHEGHRRLLQRAKALGDYLIVGVTDNIYDELRGKLDTVDSFDVRARNAMATGFVDEIIVEDHFGQKAEDIKRLGVDVFAIGSDWRGKFDFLRQYCDVIYLDRTIGVSSTQLREQCYPTLRIGIVGSGRIARRFVPEARAAKHVHVASVFNPHLKSALTLQSQFKLDFATDDEDEFYSSVDAVYIATPHESHVAYAQHALEAGKHVLVEKPLALCGEDAEMLFALAKRKGLVLAEALKTAYSPGFCKVVDLVQSGVIGDVVDVEACFTRLTPAGCRERDDAVFGGSFLELGSYAMLPALRLLGSGPDKVRFDVVRDARGVDLFTKAHLRFGNSFACGKVGLGAKSEGELVVSGTQGAIVVSAPWWKPGHCEVHFEDPSHIDAYDFEFAGDGLRYEVSDFTHRILKHAGRRDKLPERESLAMARIMGTFMEGEGRIEQARKSTMRGADLA